MRRVEIIDQESEVVKELPLLADGVVVVSLHVGPVPEPGLHDGVLQHPDPHVHAEDLLADAGQTLADADQRRAVRHAAAALLHLRLEGLDLVRDARQHAAPLRHPAAHLLVLLLVLGQSL